MIRSCAWIPRSAEAGTLLQSLGRFVAVGITVTRLVDGIGGRHYVGTVERDVIARNASNADEMIFPFEDHALEVK